MTQKFYVTMTWHDWPEGGSFGTIVEAANHAEAEDLCRAEMAASYSEAIDEEVDPDDYDWHLVDCFKVEDFHNHKQAIGLLDQLLNSADVRIDTAAATIIEEAIELLR